MKIEQVKLHNVTLSLVGALFWNSGWKEAADIDLLYFIWKDHSTQLFLLFYLVLLLESDATKLTS